MSANQDGYILILSGLGVNGADDVGESVSYTVVELTDCFAGGWWDDRWSVGGIYVEGGKEFRGEESERSGGGMKEGFREAVPLSASIV